MLNSDSNPANPAAMAAIAWCCGSVRAVKETPGWPISEPPKISCSIGDAMLSTPMPAETFMHSTTQMHQKAAVLWASRRCT